MPKISNEREVFKTAFFSVREIDIEFDNGKKATYSKAVKKDSALIVPITDDGKLVLIKEYFAAIDEYQLCLPKGQVDDGNPLESANKELQEEAGYRAKELIKLKTVLVSPGNMVHKTHIYLAKGLEKSRLKGDEECRIETKEIPFDDFEKLIMSGEFNEARAIGALYLAKNYVKKELIQ